VRWRGYKKWEIGIFFPSLLLLSILDFLVELDLSFLKAFACVTSVIELEHHTDSS
jgi:hypothetical protein